MVKIAIKIFTELAAKPYKLTGYSSKKFQNAKVLLKPAYIWVDMICNFSIINKVLKTYI